MADFALPDIFAEIDKQAPAFGIDPMWAKALVVAENTGSGSTTGKTTYSGAATSPVGARGLMQVMPATARGLQQAGLLPATWTHDPTNLGSQISAGLAAMKDMASRTKNPGDPLELAAYYNGGTSGLKNYQAGTLSNPETTQYLKKVQRAMTELGMQPTPQQIEQMAMQGPTGGQAVPAGTRTSTATSTGRSWTQYQPDALDGFLTQANLMTQPGGLFDQGMAGVAQREQAQVAATQDLLGAIGLAGKAAAATAGAEATQLAANTVVRQGILDASNLNSEWEHNRMRVALDKIDATSAQLDALRPEIDQKMGVGFFDNPLAWLVNQMELPGLVNRYNAVVGQQQDAIGHYDAASSIASKQLSLGQAAGADKILEVGAAKSQQALAEADAKAKAVQLQMSSKVAADELARVQLGLQTLGVRGQVAQLTKQQMSERQSVAQAMKDNATAQSTVDDINRIIKAAGGAGSLDVQRFKQLPAAEREQLLQIANSGKFGKDFTSSLLFVEQYGSLPAMAQGGQNATVNWIQKTLQQGDAAVIPLQQKAAATGDKTFNPAKVKIQVLDGIASQYQTQAEGDLRSAPVGNPFKLDYQMAVTAPEMAENLWAKPIIEHGPGSANPLYQKIDEQQMMNRALHTISTVPPEQRSTFIKQFAADTAKFYQNSTAAQALETRYVNFGLHKPQKTYSVNLPEFMGPAESIDLGNPTQVENFLTRQYARSQNLFRARSGNNFNLIN